MGGTVLKALDFVAKVIEKHTSRLGWETVVGRSKYSESTLKRIKNRLKVKPQTLIEIVLNLDTRKLCAQMLIQFPDEFPDHALTAELLLDCEEALRSIPDPSKIEILMYTGAEVKPTLSKLKKLLPHRQQQIDDMLETGEAWINEFGEVETLHIRVINPYSVYQIIEEKCSLIRHANPSNMTGRNFTGDYWLYDEDYDEIKDDFVKLIEKVRDRAKTVTEHYRSGNLRREKGNYACFGGFLLKHGIRNLEDES